MKDISFHNYFALKTKKGMECKMEFEYSQDDLAIKILKKAREKLAGGSKNGIQ